MDREAFRKHLCEATEIVVPFTREFVFNQLPDRIAYQIHLNQSFDGNPLQHDEEVYPGDSHAPVLTVHSVEEVVERLHRKGKVPEWINVTVASADEQCTFVRLDCCGRFTARDGLLYHQREGHPPFHCLGPALPPNWESLGRSGKFDLYWRSQRSE